MYNTVPNHNEVRGNTSEGRRGNTSEGRRARVVQHYCDNRHLNLDLACDFRFVYVHCFFLPEIFLEVQRPLIRVLGAAAAAGAE